MPSAYVGSILTVNPGSWTDEVVNINVTSTNVVSTVVSGKNHAWLITLSSAPTAPFNGWQPGDIYVPLDSTWYVNNGFANWIGPTAPPHYSVVNVSGNIVTVVGDYQLNNQGWASNISTTPTIGVAIITRPRIQRKFQWYRGTTPIPSATAATYTLSAADAGQQVLVKETAFAWNTPDSTTTITSSPYDVVATPGSDKLVFQDNIAYVGSFKVGADIPYPNPSPVYENRALSINPLGYNGNTTMFLNGSPTSRWLGEFQIPTPKQTGDFAQMNNAPMVRTPLMVDPTEGQLYASGMNGGVANSIWGSLMIPGTSKMLVSAVNWYTYNPTALFWRRPVDLSVTGQVETPFMVLDTTSAGTGSNPRWTSGFMCYIPSTPVNGVNYQTVLGGNVLSGVCGISIASTQSAGPAAISWNYNDIDATLAKASSGSVQAATISTITMASSASATNDFYNGHYLYVSSGPGAGACVKITGYVGSTKVATVAPHVDAYPWISAVNITSVNNTNPVKIRVLRAYIGDRTGIRISGVGGTTQLNGNTYYLKYAGGDGSYSDCELYTDINLTISVNGSGYGSYTSGGTINGTPTTASTYITYPILQGRQLVGYKNGTDLQRFQEGEITPIWSWNSGARGMCIPDGTRSLLFFGGGSDGKGIYSPRYYIASQSNYGPIGYDPVGQGTGPHAYPYSIRIWAYDLDELAKVYRNEKGYNDVKPYGVFTLQLPGANPSADITSANYDPATKRVYIATGSGPNGGAVVHAYQITNAVSSSIITAPATTVDVTNSMTVNLPSGTATNYPYQFGRIFKQGAIVDYPQVLLDGNAITTQADVKNRWPDGSVKFAVISVILPFIGTITKTITFQNQATNNSTAETVANMLADYNFNCTINATVAATPITGAPVAARSILSTLTDSILTTNTTANSPNSRYWTKGSVCTTVILADHTDKIYDFGTSSNKSLRPVFQVQFWPSINAYRVRVIVEQSDTTKLQSQTYDVSLSTGNTSPSVVYTKAAVPHNYGSRWTKQFWVGAGAPSQELNVQHNVGYLASTKAIPNYDSSISLSNTTKVSMVSGWASAAKDLYDTGLWNKSMPATGGRPDIGIFPDWHIAALFSGDNQLWTVVKGQADLAGAWPMCFRSGDTRTFDSTNLSAGKGKIATRDSHPTQFLNVGNYYMNQSQHGIAAADLWNVVGTISDGGWSCDDAHQPDPYYLLYITGGDYWHLEQLQFWSSWSLFGPNPGNAAWASGRDPRDVPIQGQVRGVAWALRNRARSAYASVDGTPEKIYLTRATEQALRQFEGRQISTVGNDPSGIRQFWATTYPLGTPNLLRYWDNGGNDPGIGLSGLNSTVVGTGGSPWMFSMLVSALAHTTELGFNAQEIFSWAAQAWITLINSGDVDPRHLADYRYPVKNKAGSFYQNWHDALNLANYNPAWTSVWEADKTNLNHGYANFASLAVAMSANEPGGASAWSWMNANGYSTNDWSQNPKMAVIPRLEASSIITSPSTNNWAPTTLTATIDGAAATLTQVDAITTRSGIWWVDSLGQFGDSHVYAMRFSGNPAFVRLLVMRRAFTVEAGDGTTLDTRSIALTATLNGTTYSWNAGCVQGSVRVVQNQEPIAPNPNWIREAVTNYKVTAFRRENAYNPATFTPASPNGWRGDYDPTSLGPNSSGTTPTSSNNYVGTTSGQGGEYTASRSFLHDIDAGIIDRALHNEDAAINSLWPQFVQYTFYSLSHPQAANWSTTNHVTADPFFPISSADKPYEMGGVAGATNPAVDTLRPVSSPTWGRAPSHLENTGYVHWLATEDPVAALVVQRQLAYIIASYYEYRRPAGLTTYRCYDEQGRGVYNNFSALFKNKVITDSISTLNGKWLWGSARINKMVIECISYLDGVMYAPVSSATTADPVKYTQKIISSYESSFPGNIIPAYGGPYDGQIVYATSNFFSWQYAAEPLYLWTRSGNTIASKWFTGMAQLFSNLMVYIGGASAVDQTNSTGGSARPIILASATTPYTNVTDWANWWNSINPTASRTNFNASYSHSVNRIGNTLRLARGAGIAGLDPAIANFDSFKAATTASGPDGGVLGNWPKNCMGL
jgi:hypothetical protein